MVFEDPYNIFWNLTLLEVISGNIATTTSDHLPQLLISPNAFANLLSNKSKVFERNWASSNQENLVLDYSSIDWKACVKIKQENVNFFLETYKI